MKARSRNISNLIIRAELMSETDRYTQRTIIAGFPGVGKSTAAEKYPEYFLDMESSDYHWITDENGNKTANPMWPVNYFKAIMEAANKPFTANGPRYLYVLTSTHKEVLDLFRKCHIYYMAVLPKSKDIYIQRYIDRKSSSDFIKKLDANFESFIKDVEESSAFGIHYTDHFLAELYNPAPEDIINPTVDYTNFGDTTVNISVDE